MLLIKTDLRRNFRGQVSLGTKKHVIFKWNYIFKWCIIFLSSGCCCYKISSLFTIVCNNFLPAAQFLLPNLGYLPAFFKGLLSPSLANFSAWFCIKSIILGPIFLVVSVKKINFVIDCIGFYYQKKSSIQG